MSNRKWVVGGMAVTLGAYGFAMARIVHGLTKLKPGTNDWQYSMSVIIPTRNEEANIRACLEGLLAQDYPQYFYEIIVVNDRSTDKTAAIVEEMRKQHPRIRLVDVTEVPDDIAPKKFAVTTGIEHAIGRIIVTTDADCVHPKTWLAGINKEFTPDVGVVVGHTVYRKPENWFEGLQAVD
jgi:glycosyltransferase involved in cell wall biosynthesis